MRQGLRKTRPAALKTLSPSSCTNLYTPVARSFSPCISSFCVSLGGILMVILLLTFSSLIVAAPEKEDKMPLGCKNVGYRFDLKVLKLLPAEAGDRQSLYFIFNALNKPINLYQMRKKDSTQSLYLNHSIKPRQWAVFSTSEKVVKYICTIDDPKLTYGQIVDCGSSLKVCEYARVKYGLNNKGNYWVVNSNSRGGAVFEVLHYGIIPR